MGKFQDNDLIMKDGQKIILGDNEDAYMFWDGTQMVFHNISISGTPGPPGPPGSGSLGHTLYSDDGLTGITPVDEGQISFETLEETLIRIQNDGTMTIGADIWSSTAQLDVVNDANNATIGIRSHLEGASAEPRLILTKSSGGVGAKLAVTNGDNLGAIDFQGYDTATTSEKTARIVAKVEGAVSTDTVPTDLIFETGENASGRAEVLRLTSNGYMKLGDGYANDISNDVTLVDSDEYALVTEHAAKSYIDAQVLATYTTISGVYRIVSQDSPTISGIDSVECIDSKISFKLNLNEVASITTDGFSLSEGASVYKIDTDSSLSSSESVLGSSLVTAQAIKEYVDNVAGGGGGGGSYSYKIISDDLISEYGVYSTSANLKVASENFQTHNFISANRHKTLWLGNRPDWTDTDDERYYNSQRFITDVVIRNDEVYGTYGTGAAEVGLTKWWPDTGITIVKHERTRDVWPEDYGGTQSHSVTGGKINFVTSRGTADVPKVTVAGDIIGSINWYGISAAKTESALINAFDMSSRIVARNAGGSIPTDLEFYTTSDRELPGSANSVTYEGLQKRMSISHTGLLKLYASGHTTDVASINEFTANTPRYNNTSVPTGKAVMDYVTNAIAVLAAQDHYFNTIHNDTSGYNVRKIGISCSTETVQCFIDESQLDYLNPERPSIFWEMDFGNISGFEPTGSRLAALRIGNAAHNKVWMESASSLAGNDSQNSLFFLRSHSYESGSSAWGTREAAESSSSVGMIAGLGYGLLTERAFNPCRYSGTIPPRISGKIEFFASKPGNYATPMNIVMATGTGDNEYDDYVAKINLPNRLWIQSSGRTVLGQRVIGTYQSSSIPSSFILQNQTTHGNNQSNMYAEFGWFGVYQLEYRGTQTVKGTAAVFSTESYAENSGGSIVLGGRTRSPSNGTNWASNPDNGDNAIKDHAGMTFAKIQGAKADGIEGNNSGRLRFMIHTNNTAAMKEVMRLESTRKVLIASADSGQGFDVTPVSQLMIHQSDDTYTGSLGLKNTAGTAGYMFVNSAGRFLMYAGSGGTGDIRLNNTGKVGIGCDPNTGGIATFGGTILPKVDNSYDLGNITYRWDDVYATNATIQTSDARLKTRIGRENLGLKFVNSLKPTRFVWKDGGVREHHGFLAQEVEQVLAGRDFAGLIKDKETGRYGLRYNEFISVLTKAIQELSEEVKDLKKQLGVK